MALQPVVRDFERVSDRGNGYSNGRDRGTQWVEQEKGERAGRMEEDTELEEGEALEGGPPDLDLRFGYLDTKIEEVLGHCQKEFQGSLFTDRLGAKVGCYGSFLPAHVRGAPVLTGPPPAAAGVPPRSRPAVMERGRRLPGNGSSSASDRVPKVLPNETKIKNNVPINGVSNSHEGSANLVLKGNNIKDGGPVDQKKGRSFTLRINSQRQGVNKVGKKEMYNGFGLDNSSSPSSDGDPDDTLSASEDGVSPDRSPLDMIRIMTSHLLPGGELLSPMSDILSEPPARKEKTILNAKLNKKKTASSFVTKPDLGPGSVATKLSNDMEKDTKVSKVKLERVKRKLADRGEATQLPESGKVGEKDTENGRQTGKEGGGNGLRVSHKISAKERVRDLELKGEKTDRDGVPGLRDVDGKEVENIKDYARGSRKEKVVSTEVSKGDGLELPTLESREVWKLKEDTVKDSNKRFRETSVEPNLKEIATKEPLKEKRKLGGNKDALKAKREEETLQKDSHKQQYRNEIGKGVEDVVADKEVSKKDSPLEVKKKGKDSSKASQTLKEASSKAKDAGKDYFRGEIKAKKEVGVRDIDDNRKEEPKESSKPSVGDVFKEIAKGMVKWDGIDHGLKEVKPGKKAGKKGGKEQRSLKKEKETLPADDFLGPIGDGTEAAAPQSLLLPLPAGPGAIIPAGASLPAVQLVLDHWVQCDNCQHWRILPPMIHPDDLPLVWLCKMMSWLPGLNNCKFSEEVTTAALYKKLGLQTPNLSQANPGLQAQQQLLAPALVPSDQMMDTKIVDAKPAKVQRSGSKKGMGKKTGVGTVKVLTPNVKKTETGSVKSKSLNDVVQHPVDRGSDRIGLEEIAAEDVGYTHVIEENIRKVKQKEKLMRMWESEGDDLHPHKQMVHDEEQNRASGSLLNQEWGQLGRAAVKVPGAVEADNVAEGNAWSDSPEPEPSKQQKGKLLQDGSKGDSVGLKRKKKTESSEEYNELRSGKKSKADETESRRGAEGTTRRKAHDDGDAHSLQYISDEGAVQEGESGDRSGFPGKNVGRGVISGQPLKKVKRTSTSVDLPDDRADARQMRDKEVSRKAELKERDTQPEGKKRMKGDELDSEYQIEKRRMVSRPEVKERGASREALREGKKGQLKRVGISPETEYYFHSQQSQVGVSPKVDNDEDMKGKNARLFDEISGIARTYGPEAFPERADESPRGESPVHDVGAYTEKAHHQTHKGESRPHSPISSFSKLSYSAGSSPFGSKGGSPIESTVSSSPVRSSKVDGVGLGRGLGDDPQNNHTSAHSHPLKKLNTVSPSPKRSGDRDADAHSDREEALRQSHRNWDDRPHSSDPEQEFRGPGRDPPRDTSSGHGRDDRYTTSSREGTDFRKYDRSRGGRDDDRYWEEGRETRAGSASYFPERYDRHRDDRYREREDSVDRYRDRDNRYERRSSREDRFRDRDRDRERDRSRENWTSDRGGDGREDRYSRERSVRQDRGGRPLSRESRLDKQGGLNWRDEGRLVRDVGREGRDRVEDDNGENKHEIRSNHVEGPKDEHHGEDEHEATQDVQKDDSGHRNEKTDLGPPKDTKSNFLRAPPPGQASHGWEGERVSGVSSGRKESGSGALRNGPEAQAMATHVNIRCRVEGMHTGPGSMGVHGKAGQVDGAALDVRIVEGNKLVEYKKGTDEDALMRVGVSKKAHSSVGQIVRVTEGSSSSPDKKDHASLAQNLKVEAVNLKRSADRMKNVPSMEGEIPNLYLQASLKFLQAAHHFEMASMESGRQSYTTQSVQLYNDTAKVFDFCARTYEGQRDLPAAALAHLCAFMARFRGITGKSTSLNKDCMELQNAATSAAASQVPPVLTPPAGLLLPPPPPAALSRAPEKPRSSHGVGAPSAVGESPSSSSASDVDNLNNHAIIASDKGLSGNAVKGIAPSPIPTSTGGSTDLVPLRHQATFVRVCRTGPDLFAMNESRIKATTAIAAAEMACGEVPHRLGGIDAVRKVAEIGIMGTMDAAVRQVRLALEAINH